MALDRTDTAIADEHATFGVTCRRWNIGLADGGTQRLTRILGYRRAIEFIITGREIDAHEAHRTGVGRPLDDWPRIEAHCFERSIVASETSDRRSDTRR
jgi:enoyl-CoA hydratase